MADISISQYILVYFSLPISYNGENMASCSYIINRQKVSLYEHADNLENDLTAMATGEWVNSGKVMSSCDISVTMVTTIDYQLYEM